MCRKRKAKGWSQIRDPGRPIVSDGRSSTPAPRRYRSGSGALETYPLRTFVLVSKAGNITIVEVKLDMGVEL